MSKSSSHGLLKAGALLLGLCLLLALSWRSWPRKFSGPQPAPFSASAAPAAQTPGSGPKAAGAGGASSKAGKGDEKRLARLTYANGWKLEAKPAFAPFNDWVGRYLAAPASARPGMVAEGEALAETRRHAMEQLIQEDPKEAIASTVPADILSQLPPLVLNRIEKRVSGNGNYNVAVSCFLPREERADRHDGDTAIRQVALDGKILKAFAYGRRLAEGSKYNIPLHGIALGDLLALHESPIRVLEFGESASASHQVVTAPVAPSGAALGIEVGMFAIPAISAIQAFQLEADLLRAEFQPGPYVQLSGFAQQLLPSLAPVPAEPWTTGTQRVLIIRVDFSDIPGEPISKGAAQNLMDSSVKPFYEQGSFYQDTIDATVSEKTYRMPYTGAAYATGSVYAPADALATGNDALHLDAEALASADYDLASYDRIGVVFSYLGGISNSIINYGGLANIGGKRFWVNGEFDYRVVAHELGHTYGLFHANLWQLDEVGANPTSAGQTVEYGDDFDTMGADFANIPVDFGPSRKAFLNWIPEAAVLSATSSGVYRVYRFDDAAATPGNPMALTVAGPNDRSFWINYRKKNVQGSNLATSAYILWHDDIDGIDQRLAGYTHLLDCSSPGANVADAGLPVGSSLTDPDTGLTITPLATGGNVPNEYLDVQISFNNAAGFEKQVFDVKQADGSVALVVKRTGDGTGTLRVNYSTVNGSAQSPRDYTGNSGTLLWQDGDLTSRTISVGLKPGQIVNGTLSFSVVLTNPLGGYLSSQSATVNIHDPGAVNTSFVPPNPKIADNTGIVTGPGTLNPDGDTEFPLTISEPAFGAPLVGSFTTASGTLDFIGGVATIVSSGMHGNLKGDVQSVLFQPDGKMLVARENKMAVVGPATVSGYVLTGPEYSGTSTVTSTGVTATGTAAIEGSIFAQPTLIKVSGTVRTTGAKYFAGSHVFKEADLTTTLTTGTTEILGTTCVSGSFQVLVPTQVFYFGTIAASGTSNEVGRLLADGTYDPDFNSGLGAVFVSGTAGAAVRAVQLQPDGRILIGGNFDTVEGTPASRVARLNSDGTLDESTFTASFPEGEVRAIAIQPDSRILIGGAFEQVNGVSCPYVARLNADGSLDTSFTSPLATGTAYGQGAAECIAIQPDGAILVGGSFALGTSNGIGRLLASGTVDPSFNPGMGVSSTASAGVVKALALQRDGAIVVGGNFNQFNGQTCGHLTRLNPDGTLDSSFVASVDPSGGPASEVRAIAIDSGAGIVFGGEFARVNSYSITRLARLNSDGTLDPTFYLGTGVSNTINSISLAGDGAFAIGLSMSLPRPASPVVQGIYDLPVALLFGKSAAAGQIQFDSSDYVGFAGGELQILVQRVGGSAGAISVNYSTVDGDAVAGTDYVAQSGTLTWADGDVSSRLIPISIIGNSAGIFYIDLGIPIGGVQIGSPAWAAIEVGVGNQVPEKPVNATPGDAATGQALGVTLVASLFSDPDTGDAHQASQWLVERVSDHAIVFDSGSDSTKLTSIELSPILDPETQYTWRVRYMDNNGGWSAFSDPTAFTTHAQPAFGFSASSYFVAENVSTLPAGTLKVVVTRSLEVPETTTVKFSTRNGTARNGLNYTGTSGVLTFSGTEVSQTISIAITDNAYPSGNSQFFIDLSNPTGGAIVQSPGSTMATIQDNETPSFFPFIGNYSGLIGSYPSSSLYTGFITVSMDRNGSFTASIQYGGSTYRLKGRLEPYGTFTGRIPNTYLTLNLALDMSGKDLFTGTLSDGFVASPITADRAVFDSKRFPASQKGSYTVLISGTDTASNLPQGTGYGTFNVDGNGRGRFTCTLGDGTKASQSLILSKKGAWSFYVPLYKNQGSISGVLQFRDVPLQSDVDGQLSWFKPPLLDKLYPFGFTVRSTLIGSRYVAPPKGTRALPYHNGAYNTAFATSGGGVVLAAPEKLVTWLSDNKVVTDTPDTFKMSINSSSGLFSGFFLDEVSGQTKSYKGVLLQKANIGGGCFFGNGDTTGSVKVQENLLAP